MPRIHPVSIHLCSAFCRAPRRAAPPRTTHGFKPPFRLHATVEPDPNSEYKALLTLKLWCEVGGAVAGTAARNSW